MVSTLIPPAEFPSDGNRAYGFQPAGHDAAEQMPAADAHDVASQAFRDWQAEEPDWHEGLQGRDITLESGRLRDLHAVKPEDNETPRPRGSMSAREFFSGSAESSTDLIVRAAIGRRLLSSPGLLSLPRELHDRVVHNALLPATGTTQEQAAANLEQYLVRQRQAGVMAQATGFKFEGYRGPASRSGRVQGEIGASVMAANDADMRANSRARREEGGLTDTGLPKRVARS